jgi:hypothetical protein
MAKKTKNVQKCANIRSLQNPTEQCIFPVKKGDYCSRHWKNPRRYNSPAPPTPTTRSLTQTARKLQKWWKTLNGRRLSKERGPAFFCRELCHNDTEIASFEPLSTIPRDYFFVVNENKKLWGFDLRALLIQYEQSGKLENMYTTEICQPATLEKFRMRIDSLRQLKKPLVYDNDNVLTLKQSWNLRVLDACLRLDMLGYRIATQWFSDLNINEHRNLYTALYNIWNSNSLSNQQRLRVVPEYELAQNKLFKCPPENLYMKTDMDSIRRTNLNIIERLISSASEQSDKTLGAMYTVMGLCKVSYRCRAAYEWLAY